MKSLNLKLLDMKKSHKDPGQSEALVVKGKGHKKDKKPKENGNKNQTKMNKSSKSHKNLNYFHCNKIGYVRKNCPERLKTNRNQRSVSFVDEGYESA